MHDRIRAFALDFRLLTVALLALSLGGVAGPAVSKQLCVSAGALAPFCADHPGRACAFAGAAAKRGEGCDGGKVTTDYQRQALTLACEAGGDCAVIEAQLCEAITAAMAEETAPGCEQKSPTLVRIVEPEPAPAAEPAPEEAAQDQVAEAPGNAGTKPREGLAGAPAGLPDTGMKKLPGGAALRRVAPPGAAGDGSAAGN